MRSPSVASKKRNSASAATERGANFPAKSQDVERHFFTTTHVTAGWVEQSGKDFAAFVAPDRRSTGTFPSLGAAAAAIDAAYGGAE